ncbi:MAG: hypothetical protein AAGA60_09785 [Cyanobacteria bacterium P01_E01_bin.42]
MRILLCFAFRVQSKTDITSFGNAIDRPAIDNPLRAIAFLVRKNLFFLSRSQWAIGYTI